MAALALSQPLQHLAVGLFRLPLSITESVLSVLASLPSLPRLSQENAALRAELAARQLELVRLRESVRQLSRTQVLTAAAPEGAGIVASIIGRTLVPTEHLVILNRGASHGITKHAVVIDAAGVVGRIVDVQSTTSTAMLLTDPDSRISCMLERSRDAGLLVGTGESMCQLIYLDLVF